VSNGTRLYQSPRSPLIQGRSKRERPLWESWLAGACGGGVIIAVTLVVASRSLRVYGTPFGVPLGWVAVGTVVGSAIGSLVGRSFGWRWRWVPAVVAGVICGLGVWATLYFPAHTPIAVVR
jgi:predicted MFS family arabinose efflux permease